MIDPGRLRYRFRLEAPVDADDGEGGVTRAYQAIAPFWAEMMPLSLAQGIEDGARESRATHRLVLRALPGLTIDHRLRLGDERLFRILAFRDEPDRMQRLLVEEVLP